MVKIGSLDITNRINQGGISEGAEKVTSDNEGVKGAYPSYSFTLSCVTDTEKALLDGYAVSSSVSVTVDDTAFTASIESYTSSIQIECDELRLWNVNMNIKGTALL